jgi:hypothetical protein
MEEIILEGTLFESHIRGLLRLFPPDGQYSIIISDDKGRFIEVSTSEKDYPADRI